MRWFLRSALIIALATLGGCASVLNAVVPYKGYRLLERRAYAEGPRHGIDVYLPDPMPAAPAPIAVFFYGGAWREGDKAIYRFVGQAFASRGIVVAIPDYRLYPEVVFPAFLEDGAAAIAWVRAHAAEFGADPKRLFLVGHSAGAYNAVMLSLDRRWLGAVGLYPARDLAGTVGLAGPYDFLPFDADTAPVFGNVAAAATQPVNFADGRAPPLLLIAGTGDTTVRPRNSARLADVVRAQGGAVRLITYPRVGHIGLIASMAAPLHWIAPTLADTLAFIRDPAAVAPPVN